MADECDDLAGTPRIDAAVALLRRLRAEAPETPLERLALQAVDTVFCARVAFASDAVECRVGGLEAELAAEIVRRMLAVEGKPMPSTRDDRVEGIGGLFPGKRSTGLGLGRSESQDPRLK